MSSNSSVIFEDLFAVGTIDKDGKKFDRVSRLTGASENYKTELVLDFNSELIQFAPNSKFTLALAKSLKPGGGHEDGFFDASKLKGKSLADDYDYVMFGKVYKFTPSASSGSKTQILVSFGGLLMSLEGEMRYLDQIQLNEQIYLLVRQ